MAAGPTSPLALSSLSHAEVEELRAHAEEQTRTIAQLEQEKQLLVESVERLQQVESRTSHDLFSRRYPHADIRVATDCRLVAF